MHFGKPYCLVALLVSAVLCLAFPGQENRTAASEAVAEDLVNTLRKGLIAHNPDLMLSAFDRGKMAGYNAFADQVRALFDQYDSFQVYAHVTRSSVENDHGTATVDFEMEETPHDPSVPPARKQAQLQLQLERGAGGWKIVNFSPRNLFS